MPTAASLNVLVKANTANFTKGVKGIATSLGGLKNLFAGFSLGAAGYAFKRIAEDIDNTVKTSRKLGITIAGLQGLRVAAERTGATVETLDKGLALMVRNVSDAASGTGEARDALAQLGLDAKRLNALAPDEQFRAIADAMRGVAVEGDRVRISFDLFGRSGVALKNALAGGSSELKQYADEAKRLGLVFGEKQGKDIERFVDAVGRLKALMAGFGQKVVIELGPGVADTIEGLVELIAPTKVKNAAPVAAKRGGIGGILGSGLRGDISSIIRGGRVALSWLYPGLYSPAMQSAVGARAGEIMTPEAARRAARAQASVAATATQLGRPQFYTDIRQRETITRTVAQVWKTGNLLGRGLGGLSNLIGGSVSLPQLQFGKLGRWLVGNEFATRQPRNAVTGIGAAIQGTPEAMKSIFETTFGRNAQDIEREKRDLLQEIRDILKGDQLAVDPVFG